MTLPTLDTLPEQLGEQPQSDGGHVTDFETDRGAATATLEAIG